jgi:hypothetical protein
LKAKGLTEEQIDFVMAENGKDVEAQKTKATAAETEREGLKTQLADANKTIEGFRALKVDEIQKAADDWKTKAEKAEADRIAQVSQLKFDHALDNALTGAKAKNVKAVRALLDQGTLKLKEDGTIDGLDDQLKKVKEDNGFLFNGEKEPPQIVTGASTQSGAISAFLAAARKGGNFPEQSK